MKSTILWRDKAKAYRGEVLLFSLWLIKAFTKLPLLKKAYHSLLIHLVKKTELFDRCFYLERNGDAIQPGTSALRHSITCGDRQGRMPMAFFDPDHYRASVRSRTKYVNTLLHYANIGRYRRISPSPWFDVDYYLAHNKDVLRSGIDPILHYLRWGGLEGRSPCPEFDGSYYLRTNRMVGKLRMNPLVHYLNIGRLEGKGTLPEEGREDLDSASGEMPEACIPDETSWDELVPRADKRNAFVDVIVPIYQGRAETLRCLHSILSSSSTVSFELVVIDDAGPDADLKSDLRRLSERGLFTLLSNSENCGFVCTANRGISLHPQRDVVLLNSDTQVFDGWLDRLHLSSRRHSRTGTVTPLSNNATICSYPRVLQDNPFPLELGYAELDALAAEVNAGIEVEAPTGIGFCMYIKREALNEVGPFDEAEFGRGYGEENDFCQRALKMGWRNIIAANIFVHHYGSASFQGEKAKRLQEALKKLDRLHPTYHRDVAAFIQRDPLLEARRRLDRARLLRLRRDRNILIISHNRGGGAERHIQEDIRRLSREGYGIFLLRPTAGEPSHVLIRHHAAKRLPNLPSYPLADTAALATVLKELGITEVHTHSLVDFSPNAPALLMPLVAAIGARWEINLHDYKVVCPRINLADKDGFYCGEPAESACDRCLVELGSDFCVTDIRAWRAMHRLALLAADQVLVPDPDVADRLGPYFPDISFNISPHEDIDPAHIRPRHFQIGQKERLRIVVIGAIGKIKGYDVLLACARNARKRRLPLEFILMGYSMNDRLLKEAGVSVTGRYLEEKAQETLEALSPHVAWLPSVWPETYSYTLSVALYARLPVAAFDIGAIARRLGQGDLSAGHCLFPLGFAKRSGRLNDHFVDIRSSCLEPVSGGTLRKPVMSMQIN